MAGQPDREKRLLCWERDPDGEPKVSCDRVKDHLGRHSWEFPEPPAHEPSGTWPTLTDAEHRLVTDIGRLMDGFNAVVGDGPSRDGDLAEAVRHIHVLQNMVLAQAASRAYPDRYRLMGASFDGSKE